MLLLQISNTSYRKIISLLIAGVFAVFVFSIVTPASALTLSPVRIQTDGDPGTTKTGEVTVINEQNTTQTFYASYENFSAEGETGAPTFNTEKTGLDTWITVSPQNITLAPGEARKVSYTITIPKDTEPGGYFAAIFWGSTPPSVNTAQVSIGAKVGVLILLTVNGQIAESAGITQFDRDGHGFFYTTLPVDLRYKFRNSGGDRVEPKGEVTIRDTIFLPTAHIDANPNVGNVLPNSVRAFTVEWLRYATKIPIEGFFNTVSYQWHNFALGLYSAHLDLVYGAAHTNSTQTVWFFVFPWQLVLCLIIILCVILWCARKLISRYNRYIVTKALKNR